jgi:hypothetical protein
MPITTLDAAEAGSKCCPLKLMIITPLVGYPNSPNITKFRKFFRIRQKLNNATVS